MKKKIITIVSLIMMISMLTAMFGCSTENSGVICEITSITWDDEYFEQIPESDLTDYLPENVYGDELCDIATWQYFLDNKSSYSAYKINFVVTNNTSGMATDIVINFKEDYGRSVIMYSDFDSVPFFEKGTCDWEEHILILVEDKALSESEKIELLESIELTATYEVVLKTPLEFLMCDASATGEGKGGDVEFVKSEDFEITVCTSDSDEEIYNPDEPSVYEVSDEYTLSDSDVIDSGKLYKLYYKNDYFTFRIFDSEGNIAKQGRCWRCPKISEVNDSTVLFTLQMGTGLSTQWGFFYDCENNIRSDKFNCIYDHADSIFAYGAPKKVIVRSIFSDDYYREFTEFENPLADSVEPILYAELSDDAKTITITYLTGEDYREVSQDFSL